MPAPAPFAPNSAANNALFPALYLYPLNDTWAPKHIALTNQHTKIGRQTSSKTAPGERNGFFDSKVLSRQHAEVWEDGGKIYIKDVKSSNGTFINGERLSSEGHESEPFELKSDDIVEFGIDIVGEDNKTIIHHKVAARVVCVFSEQDAQVAARAEQHQQQQQQQQHQFMQQQQQQQQQQHQHQPGGPQNAQPSGINGAMPGGIVNGGPQNFPFAQRRAQLAQGLGSMGGMRPPGKTGLSFDVILSRLQGEVQKSRETGAELNSLTTAMNEIHDTLGGAVPTNLPPFPTHLPPVRPPQETQPLPGSSSASPEQPSENPAPAVSAAVVVDLQSQLRDTQSSLASHLDKVRALEGVLAEQEVMKREVSSLREMMDERRREMEAQKAAATELETRRLLEAEHHRRQHEEDEEAEHGSSDEDDDDARSISTVMPHELESVEEEDEEEMAEDERQSLREDNERQQQRQEEEEQRMHAEEDEAKEPTQTEAEVEAEEQERRREDLGVGRPRTPEPTRMGLDSSYPTRPSVIGVARRSSLSSPISQQALSSTADEHAEAVLDQVSKLSKQVTTVLALTASLEAQHSTALSTIQALESKVATLESKLKIAQEPPVQIVRPPSPASSDDVKGSEAIESSLLKSESLSEKMAGWKKVVEGQWNVVQEEWSHERERFDKARQELEDKSRQVDLGLEKITTLQTTLASQQQMLQVHLVQHASSSLAGPSHLPNGYSSLVHHLSNGDAHLKHNGGLVTPPSPRSQSSDSGRARRKKKRSSSAGSLGSGRGRSRRSSGSAGALSSEEGDVDEDSAMSSSLTEDDILAGKKHIFAHALGAATAVGSLGAAAAAARSLATPEPSVYKLESSVNSLDSASSSPVKGHPLTTSTTPSNTDDMASLPLFFEFTQRVLLMLFWSVLSFVPVAFSVLVALFSHISSVIGRLWDSLIVHAHPLPRLLSSSTAQPETESSSTSEPSPKSVSIPVTSPPTINVQTAVGVVLLSVAAAAVFWKIKPE